MHAGRARQVDTPDVGYFLIRAGRRCPWVPARICHEWGHWWAEVDGKIVGQKDEDPVKAEAVLRIWHHGREITREEYERRLKRPESEKRDPSKPINLRAEKSIF